jgi:3-oxoacyl-[acyl-carrier protein] reductase
VRFQGKRVLVTGASEGVGRATAVLLASEGAAVAVHYDADAAGAEETATACGLASEAVPALVRGDLGDWDEAVRVVDEAAEALGGLDGLVVHAADARGGRARELTDVDDVVWADEAEDALRAAVSTSRAAARLMADRGGAIVLVAAAGAHTGDVATALAGSAVLGLVAPLGRALAPRVRVNGVALGAVAAEAASAIDDSEERRIKGDVLLRRLGRPEDAASVVLFLASDDAAFVTGRTLVVDGGRSVL